MRKLLIGALVAVAGFMFASSGEALAAGAVGTGVGTSKIVAAVWNRTTTAQAKKDVVALCKSYGYTCKATIAFSKQCGSGVGSWSPAPTAYGWGTGKTLTAADAAAVKMCKSKKGKDCTHFAHGCDTTGGKAPNLANDEEAPGESLIFDSVQ